MALITKLILVLLVAGCAAKFEPVTVDVPELHVMVVEQSSINHRAGPAYGTTLSFPPHLKALNAMFPATITVTGYPAEELMIPAHQLTISCRLNDVCSPGDFKTLGEDVWGLTKSKTKPHRMWVVGHEYWHHVRNQNPQIDFENPDKLRHLTPPGRTEKIYRRLLGRSFF